LSLKLAKTQIDINDLKIYKVINKNKCEQQLHTKINPNDKIKIPKQSLKKIAIENIYTLRKRIKTEDCLHLAGDKF
jgi:hypothetical protein